MRLSLASHGILSWRNHHHSMPVLLGVSFIYHRGPATLTHDSSLLTFSCTNPTATLTRDNIAWQCELNIVTSTAGTPDFQGFPVPDFVVVMRFADQSMGDLVEQSIPHFFCRCSLRKFVG